VKAEDIAGHWLLEPAVHEEEKYYGVFSPIVARAASVLESCHMAQGKHTLSSK